MGDHRRCEPRHCTWATRWLVAVTAAGIAECGRTGKRFTVVSTVDGEDAIVLRAFDRLQQAKPFRTKYGHERGLDWGERHGLIVVVREDGYLV